MRIDRRLTISGEGLLLEGGLIAPWHYVNRMTDTRKNITFLQLHLRAVITKREGECY